MPNSLPAVSLYIRKTDKNGNRCYERVKRINAQACGPRDVFCIHFYENRARKWLTVGTDLRAAWAAWGKKSSDLLKADRQRRDAEEPQAPPSSLDQAVGRYLRNTEATKAKKTAQDYAHTLAEFQKVCTKPINKVTKSDLQTFAVAMKNGGLSDRTISNRLGDVVTFLRSHGLKDVNLRWKYVERLRAQPKLNHYTGAPWGLPSQIGNASKNIGRSFAQMACETVLSTMREDIHFAVADIASTFNELPDTRVLLTGPECGGNYRVPLFGPGQKGRATALCCVDIGIVRQKTLKVVIEVEDRGNIGPFKVGGKLLPIALSSGMHHPSLGLVPVSPDGLLVIQVVNTAGLKPATRKHAQYGNLVAGITKLLPMGLFRSTLWLLARRLTLPRAGRKKQK